MKQDKSIAIVGGGPAGAYLGYLLARGGLQPVIFDDSHPREKPCGGGIGSLGIEKFPILQQVPVPNAADTSIVLISPKGRRVTCSTDKESWAFSRLILDQFLLDNAVQYGCRLIKEHVKNIEKENGSWKITSNKLTYVFDILIGADGANSLVRKHIIGPISKNDMGVCYGCFASSPMDENVVMKFFEESKGYAWCFPRYNNLSIGVSSPWSEAKDLKKKLNDFISTYYPHVEIKSYWGAKIPMIQDKQFYDIPCSGNNWILIGDAAGHVDPITGEGIVYALWGAALAARAISNADLTSFDMLWKTEYGFNLIDSCKSQDLFYQSFLLENIIRLSVHSKKLSTLINQLVCNEIQQFEVFFEVLRGIPRIFGEFVFSKIKKSDDIGAV